MSRTIPAGNTPSPVTRWFELDGAEGGVRYYDKEKKEQIEVGKKFGFILLDQLAVVKGWHEPSESGITSNEVRDTKAERLIVRAFKGGDLAEGFYSEIRDRIKAVGGHYTCNLYLASKSGDDLKLGCLQIKGAALNAWVEFKKASGEAVWKQSISITGWTDGKNGSVKYKTPVFKLTPITKESDDKAGEIQETLKAYHTEYFKRTRVEQVDKPAAAGPDKVDWERVEPGRREAEVADAAAAEQEDESDSVPF